MQTRGIGNVVNLNAAQPAVAGDRRGEVRVWDLFVRSFHWSLVGAVGVALATGFLGGGQTLTLHLLVGGLIAWLVLTRVVWGFLGGPFARFAGFVPGGAAVMRHLRELGHAESERHLGHNPLGALMILALLAVIAGLVATGAMIWGGIFWHGPLAADVTYATGTTARNLHWWLAAGLLALVALHVAGALFESRRSRENLVGAMLTGVKARRAGDVLPPAAVAHGGWTAMLAVAGAGAIGLAGLGWPGRGDTALARSGPPVATAGTPYAAACGECHAAFHPSLLPVAGWSALMAGLSEHFGEDASLDPATAAEIAGYLAAHAAETADTKPGHVFRRLGSDGAPQITATPFWIRTHAGLSDAVFAAPSVGSRANCAACHADAAAGWFYPGHIAIPPTAEGKSP